MSKEAMTLALEALVESKPLLDDDKDRNRHSCAIVSLHQAIAKAEKQEQGEPVAEYIGNNPDELDLSKRIGLIHRLKFIPLRSKLYTTPQQHTWVGLTDKDKDVSHLAYSDLSVDYMDGYECGMEVAEDKLKERNT